MLLKKRKYLQLIQNICTLNYFSLLIEGSVWITFLTFLCSLAVFMLIRWCPYTVMLLMDFSDFSFLSSVCARSLQNIYSKSHKLINQLRCRSLEVSVRGTTVLSTWPISNTQVADTYVKLLLETGHWVRYNFAVTQFRISDVSMNS